MGAGEGIISAAFEIGVVPGLQGVGSERVGREGQARMVIGEFGAVRTHPPYLLGEAELAESDSVFDEQCKVLGLGQ